MGTTPLDVMAVLARMLVPEPMRPGWDPALSMARSALPHGRLAAIDGRCLRARLSRCRSAPNSG